MTRIVDEFGTPLYIYDGNMIQERYDAVRQAFPSFDVFYSMKANPSLAVVGLLLSLGAGAEISSAGELFIAKEAGYDPLDIVFAGPGKTDRELERAIMSGLFAIHAESFRELDRILRIAQLVGIPPRVALRINTAAGLTRVGEGSAGPLHERMAGGPSKFGIDEEKIDELAGYLKRSPLEIMGIHVYTASQILHADDIVANARRTVAAAERVEQATGAPLLEVDFGGGFGVPHYEEETPLDLKDVGERVEEVFRPFSERRNTRLIIELGRYLLSESGVFVSRIIELKESRGERYAITDGGVNQFVRPVLMGVRHEAHIINRLGAPSTLEARATGPLCTPIDITAQRLAVPEGLAVGDLVGIFNAGAYGLSMSPSAFLSHAAPVEALVYDGELIEARGRGRYEDLLTNQKPFTERG